MGLLKGIDPLLSADLLHILRSMGHGDKLCICDCNFPAASIATNTTSKKHVLLTVSLPQALDAICSVLPLDHFVESAVCYMSPQQGVEMPFEGVKLNKKIEGIIDKHSTGVNMAPVERFRFYEEARECYAIVQTLERKPYGNVIFTKGVIGPDGQDLKPIPKA
mmetsp:Transcript_30767/g.35893  ORF Transcript_30767/g.35893 Transcript_30767/m.35893 type:complete len:163 (+) Transcript_30767:190-678(+)